MTAKEAKALSATYKPVVDQDELNIIYRLIKETALKGNHYVRAGITCKGIIDALNKNGYKVSLFCTVGIDHSFIIDISWS